MRVVPNLDLPDLEGAQTRRSPRTSRFIPTAAPAARPSTFEFMRDGEVIGRSAAELPPPDETGRIKYVASFPTETLHPGNYELRAVATQGATSARLANAFRADPMMARIALLAVARPRLLADRCSGQNKPPQTPPFRSESELVTVDVVVARQDTASRCANLEARDFVVSEEGRPQRVQFFQPVIAAQAAPPDRPAQRSYRLLDERRRAGAPGSLVRRLLRRCAPDAGTGRARQEGHRAVPERRDAEPAISCRSSRPRGHCAGTRGCPTAAPSW